MNRQELFEIAQGYFDAQGWQPFPFQKQTWTAFLQGKHGLLNAPTGSGKTYALWTAVVLDYIKQNPKTYKNRPTAGLKAIWITPLRSLAQEIAQSTARFVDELEIPLKVGLRTGDTPPKERAAQKRRMPDLLITTPESLQLLLSGKDASKTFRSLQAIIIDEWHELLGTKRGVQMELGLSRLKIHSGELRIWGISATIGNLDQAREVLLGPGTPELENSTMIKANLSKKIKVKSIIPEEMDTFPWRGHLGLHLLDEAVAIIKESNSTLIFTNTRSQCELWFQRMLASYPELAGEVAMHHGSIDKETRLWVEGAIRDSKLKAVVCTSSLDLGVDFYPVDTIIQVGGPKGVARFLQRAGRSGHRPGETSVIHFLPTHALELVEAAALKKAVKLRAVEDRVPYRNTYDCLVQYLVTLAIGEGFYPDEIYEQVTSTFCYQNLTREQFDWCVQFTIQGSSSLAAYDEYKKVEVEEDGKHVVKSRALAMRHRLQMGTIVSNVSMTVKYLKGGYIGTIEEFFISQLKQGDTFIFAGRALQLYRVKGTQVLVKQSRKKKGKVPSWSGGRMSLSSQMSELLREELQSMNEERSKREPEIQALDHIVARQRQESIVPSEDEFLIETFKSPEGYHHVFYPFEGRFVHEALGSLLAYRISLLTPITFSIAFNDYGFELLSDQTFDMQEVLDNDLFTSMHLRDDLNDALNETEMARRKFRDVAVISGMVFTGYPKNLIKTKHLQSSSELIFEVFRDNEPDNLLFQQAFTETFEHQLEEARLRESLERIATQSIVHKQCRRPTPFSFPIITDRLREKLSSEKLMDRIARMTIKWE